MKKKFYTYYIETNGEDVIEASMTYVLTIASAVGFVVFLTGAWMS